MFYEASPTYCDDRPCAAGGARLGSETVLGCVGIYKAFVADRNPAFSVPTWVAHAFGVTPPATT